MILGASHDNGYARLLRQLETDGVTAGKVVLLEGPPFATELQNLICATFPRIKFPGMFIEQKLPAAAAESGTKYSTVAANGVLYMSDGKSKSPILKPSVLVSKSVNPDSGIKLNRGCLINIVAYQYVQKLKPPPCIPYYIGPNGCSRASCTFSHEYELTDAHRSSLFSMSRKKPCDFYKANGRCIHGDNCIRSHDCLEAGGKCGDKNCMLNH